MCASQFVMFSTVLVCSFGLAKSLYILPAGKCNTHGFQVKPIDYPTEASISDWNILFGTDVKPLRRLDHYLVRVIYNGDMTSKEDTTLVFDNGTVDQHTAKQTYIYNFLTEDSVDAQGRFNHFHIFPLANLDDHTTLYYRCSEIGGLPVDTRYITVPRGVNLTKESFRKLMEVDASYNFTGDFLKFPYRLYTGQQK